MKLGSHNTMTYLPVRQWWLKPFAFMSRCQKLSLKEQAELTDFFDIRIRFNGAGAPVFAHGIAEYCFDHSVFIFLEYLAINKGVTPKVMISLEYSKKNGLEYQKAMFKGFCQRIQNRYPKLMFCGGLMKYNWNMVYNFGNPMPEYTQHTASTTGSKLDDWWPERFAKKNNSKALSENEGKGYKYVNIDYLGVY